MKRALLGVLVPLLALGGDPSAKTGEGGELCRNWLYGTEPPSVGVFQCVEQRDGAGAQFRCGTCNCGSLEEALAEGRLRPSARKLPAILEGEGEFRQASAPMPDSVCTVWGIALALIFIALCYWVYKCWIQSQPRSERQMIYLDDYFPTTRSVIDFFCRCGACLRRAPPSSGPERLQDNSPALDHTPAVPLHRESSGDKAIILPPASSPVGTASGHISQPSLENGS
ncbi:uncharacterized protein LOC133371441 [Rhineura floridana]|uniref:uncharacterized protein LOC133371441 n=1 Tax=Rhineura floridana TaxID=261503 RepID=UPI002AC8860C|nr:uncharacterized protein LOC133371441 [Rhineura floridana]